MNKKRVDLFIRCIEISVFSHTIPKHKKFKRSFLNTVGAIFIISSCSLDNRFFFLRKKEVCGKQKINFYKNSRKFLLEKAELCFKEKKAKRAVFILEQVLKRDKITKTKKQEIKLLTELLAKKSFYQLKNYEKALKHYMALFRFSLKPEERAVIQRHISKSFYYLKKHSQALIEIEKALSEKASKEEKKQALLLKAEIFIAQNQFDKARGLFLKQISAYPDQKDFFREQVAFVYESQKNFSLAVEELEKIEKPSSFVLNRIERLKERQSNQPGF